MDLRRDAEPLLGFMWKDLRDMALRMGSTSPGKKTSFKGDGAGEESREVLRVPGPDVDVVVDMKEKRDRPRSPSSCTWCCETGVEATDDVSPDWRPLPT